MQSAVFSTVFVSCMLLWKGSSSQTISRQNKWDFWREKKTFLMEALIFWQLEKILFETISPVGTFAEQLHLFIAYHRPAIEKIFHFPKASIISHWWKVFLLGNLFYQKEKKIHAQESICCYISWEQNAQKNMAKHNAFCFLHLWTVTSHKTPSCIDNLLK